MKLYSLIKDISCRVVGTAVLEITGLYHRDTEVKEGGLFFVLKGTKVDGRSYVSSAIKNGAVAIVSEQEIPGLIGISQVIVKNAREVMSRLACRFYGYPASKLKIIGVTGTNGKTTITNMLASVLNFAGFKSAIIGTNGIFFGGAKYDTGMTTPDPIELQKYLFLMTKSKVEFVCMEVSAHSLDLFKLEGVTFSSVIFSNLTEDHLDYFKSMESYFQAKAKLFTKKFTNFGVINLDDDYGKRLVSSINIPFKTYAINDKNADLVAYDITINGAGQKFSAGNAKDYTLQMAGKFNVYNALSVILTLKNIGISDENIKLGLANMPAVDGRFNSMIVDGKIVVIDYAHTPDGLKNILSACREIATKSKLISVFGCGGNREREKRAIMGEISSIIADFTIITSDNPRFEKREDIAKDIKQGLTNSNYKIILDRPTAIKEALNMAGEGDVIVIAGKGSEPYIDENGIKMPYSDKAEVEKFRRTK